MDTAQAPWAAIESDSGFGRSLVHLTTVHWSGTYSTRIEGNRLTQAEAEQVISGQRADFHGRERDTKEVRNCWNALLRVEDWAAHKLPLTEELVRRLHAMVEKGPRAKPTPYRDGQNVIRDSV